MTTRNTMIVAEDGRRVSHLKRVRSGATIGVSIIFEGGLFHPTKRSAKASNAPFKLVGPQLYTEKAAKAWLGTLTRAGLTGFRMEKNR